MSPAPRAGRSTTERMRMKRVLLAMGLLACSSAGMPAACDVVVIGSGPNGLAAAIVAAQHGLRTVVYEACDMIGGGLRSAELTLPGFVHDVCSSVHPMGASSPFFRGLPLGAHGLEW